MNTPANRRLVVAASYREFKDYVDREADPRLLHAYVADVSTLNGRTFTESQVILIPGWEAHPKALQIKEAIRVRMSLNGAP